LQFSYRLVLLLTPGLLRDALSPPRAEKGNFSLVSLPATNERIYTVKKALPVLLFYAAVGIANAYAIQTTAVTNPDEIAFETTAAEQIQMVRTAKD
jgi:hypothetical protein